MIRNLSIGKKLALVIAPPLIALLALVVLVVRPKLESASDAVHAKRGAEIATANMQFRDEVQVEREATLQWASRQTAETRAQLDGVRAVADEKRAALVTAAGSDAAARAELAAVLKVANSYDELRTKIDAGQLTNGQILNEFASRLKVHADLNRSLALDVSDADLVRSADAILSLLLAKDATSEYNAVIGNQLEEGSISIEQFGQVRALITVADLNFAVFADSASIAVRDEFNAANSSPEVASAESLLQQVMISASANRRPTVQASQWWPAAKARLEAIDAVEDGVFDDFVDQAEGIRSDAQRSAFVYLGGAALAAILAAVSAVLISRSIARRLTRIAADAHTISNDRLPEVLAALRNPSAEALARALPEVAQDGDDEIGDMASSFNTVLRTSVETSIAHSQRRAKTLTNILVSLGRRNQALIDKQLILIDELESSQRDPQLLQGLFKIDHMVTTMRRNAENLLVLAAETPARSWTQPVPLLDVVRGAVAEVQDMSRIHIDAPGTDRLMVSGRFAVDLSHLLAELVDNSISFSPPSTMVQISVETAGRQARIWVLDKGLGLTEDEYTSANERLEHPPEIDELSADRVGFQVIGRLSQRLGVTVRLQPNPGGGTAASVIVPATVFDDPTETKAPAAPVAVPPIAAKPVAPANDSLFVTAGMSPPIAERQRVLPDMPVQTPVTADLFNSPPESPSTPSSAGLQRRVPGANFVVDKKAEAADSGQFRRFPGGGESPASQDVDIAARRLEAISRMQASLDRARTESLEDDGFAPPPGASAF